MQRGEPCDYTILAVRISSAVDVSCVTSLSLSPLFPSLLPCSLLPQEAHNKETTEHLELPRMNLFAAFHKLPINC